MKLHRLSTDERKILYGEESEAQEELPVEGPADKSKAKWRKFHTGLEYSKNLLMNGKHISTFSRCATKILWLAW
jgi:hypothetical protein